ncbi:MAG TPA: NB-ARC domain-containing protein, partial [Nitrolancea sp.]|nr:NB-ARC domain-containing protein [Nitrolancea sp.]
MMVRRWTAATERRHPTNLTVPRDPLIGREGELDALRRLVRRADVGLVTLTGAGGIGKTRLALQAAADLLDDFPDGVHVVSLAAIRNPELVASAIGQALGVNETGDQPLMASLRALLHDRQLLLLLDNMEQVLESAPLVTSLLSSCPGLKVLATSRIVMHLSGEHEFPVPPLALPNLRELSNLQALSQSAAIALFVQRAQAIQRNFGLSAANAGIIAEICVRLDGLPLALELAAARLRVLTPADLLARLTNRLTILTGGPRDLPARQQTLRDTIDWSYDLLPSEEQRLFRRLAPFAGGFTFDAAKTLLRDPGDLADKSSRTASTDALEGISSLIDNSLAQPVASVDNEPRFAMLETIREYAIERLEESGEAGAIRRRHARYYLELVETTEPAFFNKEWPIWLRRLEQEHDNLRAALQST